MLRVLLSFLSLCVVLALSVVVWGTPPDDDKDPTNGATFVGAKGCRKCHSKQHRTWKKMKHATAWKTLPDKYKVPTEKDEQGRVCMSCHVTGWGQADRGGFENAEKSAHLLGVQCEMCHGPGSNHKAAGQKVLDEKRKKFNEGEKTFIILKPTTCADCHNPHVNHKKYAAEKN